MPDINAEMMITAIAAALSETSDYDGPHTISKRVFDSLVAGGHIEASKQEAALEAIEDVVVTTIENIQGLHKRPEEIT